MASRLKRRIPVIVSTRAAAAGSGSTAGVGSTAPSSPEWLIPVATYNLGTFAPGASIPLTGLYTANGGTPYFTYVSGQTISGTSVTMMVDSADGDITAPTTETTYTAVIDLSANTADSDWAARSAGALMATRFDTSGEVMDYRLLDGAVSRISWDTTRKVSGTGSLKFTIPAGDVTNSGNWFRHLNDAWGLYTGSGGKSGASQTATNQGFDPGTTFEVSYRVYIPASLRNNITNNGGGQKFSIISHDYSSNQSFEIVLNHGNYEGYVQGYYTNAFTGFEQAASTLCSSTDYRRQNVIDRGANALINAAAVNPDTGLPWTDCQKTWGRYGGTYSYRSAGYPNAIGSGRVWKFWEQLGTTANPLGPVLLPEDDWIAIKIRVVLNSYSAATNNIHVYVARRWHTSWQEILRATNVALPTQVVDGSGGTGYNIRYNTLWLLPYDSGRTSGLVDTFMNFDEVICKSGADSIACPTYWP
jgi:hypothetical protein